MKRLLLAATVLVAAAACGTATADTTSATSSTSALDSSGSSSSSSAPTCDPSALVSDVAAAYSTAALTAKPTPPTPGAQRPKGPRPEDLVIIGYAYDADNSGTLDDTEKAALLADATRGCAARQSEPPPPHDGNGPGCDHDGRGGPGDDDGDRPPPPPASANAGTSAPSDAPPSDATRPPPPTALERLLAVYDTDGNGTLDATELADMRADIQARIAAGRPPMDPPPRPAN